jgi:hypothetical protein
MFLSTLKKGGSLSGLYDQYKKNVRDTINDEIRIQEARQKEKNKPAQEKEGVLEISQNDVDYMKKTIAELDTLYKSNGKYRSEYMKDLVNRNIIPLWRAEFAEAIACVVQTNAILNFPYDREEFPGPADNEEFEGTDSLGKHFTLEQNKLTTPDVIEPDQDEDIIDDDIIIPE